MRRYLLAVSSVVVVLCLVGLCTPSWAAWVNIPMTNPGAETGDMTGWDTWDNRVIARNDASNAYQGDWHFFSQPSRTTNNGCSFSQTIDVSSYTGQILDLRVGVAYRYETGQRWGYDAQTNASYLYKWEGSLGTNAYSQTGHLFGIGLTLPAGDSWSTDSVLFSWRSDWEQKRQTLTRVYVQGKWMYMPVHSGSPGSWEIESWGDWVGTEPDFGAFDNFAVSVQVVPEPSSLLMLGSGLGCLSPVIRRRRR